MKGLVHIYTGDGKGKTTAALGLGMRACGRGLKVLMVQFLKSLPTGEMHSIKALEPGFMLQRGTSISKFTHEMSKEEREIVKAEQAELFDCALSVVENGGADMLILDEVLGAISADMLEYEKVADFVMSKPENLELVLTGRGAPPGLIELADYVSEIAALKHPADKGCKARKGIEF